MMETGSKGQQGDRMAHGGILRHVDHLVLGCHSLEQGLDPGGGTHNALLSLGDGQYLEIIAPDPRQPGVLGRFGDLTRYETPTLVTWAATAQGLTDLAGRLRAQGMELAELTPGSRQLPTGSSLRWQTLSLHHDSGKEIPFLIEWGAESLHPSTGAPTGCRLVDFTLFSVRPERTLTLLGILSLATLASQIQPLEDSSVILQATLSTPRGLVILT